MGCPVRPPTSCRSPSSTTTASGRTARSSEAPVVRSSRPTVAPSGATRIVLRMSPLSSTSCAPSSERVMRAPLAGGSTSQSRVERGAAGGVMGRSATPGTSAWTLTAARSRWGSMTQSVGRSLLARNCRTPASREGSGIRDPGFVHRGPCTGVTSSGIGSQARAPWFQLLDRGSWTAAPVLRLLYSGVRSRPSRNARGSGSGPDGEPGSKPEAGMSARESIGTRREPHDRRPPHEDGRETRGHPPVMVGLAACMGPRPEATSSSPLLRRCPACRTRDPSTSRQRRGAGAACRG